MCSFYGFPGQYTPSGGFDSISAVTKTLARCLEESGIGLDRLIAASGLNARVV